MDGFPTGLRVLVVNDDRICFMILERMLHQCSYHSSLLCVSLILMCPYSRTKFCVLNLKVWELMCIEHNEVSQIAVDFFLESFALCYQMFTLFSTSVTTSILSS